MVFNLLQSFIDNGNIHFEEDDGSSVVVKVTLKEMFVVEFDRENLVLSD